MGRFKIHPEEEGAMRFLITLSCALVLLATTACNSRELTRDKAKRLIENTERYKGTAYGNYDAAQISCFSQAGLVKAETMMFMGTTRVNNVQLSPEGQKVIDKIEFTTDMVWGPKLKIQWKRQALKIVVDEVTGITEVIPQHKTVEYTEYVDSSGLSSAAQSCIDEKPSTAPQRIKKVAEFQHFDDGWRIADSIE